LTQRGLPHEPPSRRPDVLEVYVTRIAEATRIPPSHIEKDYWVTEVLRGAAKASSDTGCSVVFKGGTSLSKAHHLIQRFSEDVDLIVVLPAGGAKSKDTTLKAFVEGAATATGLVGETDTATTTKGVKRTVTFAYPTARESGVLRSGVMMELGTRGGALPQRRLAVQSLITEHAESVGLPVDFDEAAPVSLLVLEPVRTLVDKLVLLHHAATEGDDARRAATARHYYDVDRLVRNDDVVAQLGDLPIDVIAREVCEHSRAAGLPTAERPKEGFAASPAWDPKSAAVAAGVYTDLVLPSLVWPGAPRSVFAECCERVRSSADLL
jgi:predicted nucleotidyltransferase component of viral defense system